MNPSLRLACRKVALLTWVLLALATFIFVPIQFAQAQDSVVGPVVDMTAEVVVSALNLREGPGVSYARATVVHAGDVLAVEGATTACSWLSVTAPSGETGWVSGDSRFVTLSVPCADVPVLPAMAASTPTPAPEAAPTEAAPGEAAPTEPAPAEAAPAEATKEIPEGKGCLDIGAYIGPDLRVSGSLHDSNPNEIFDVTVKDGTVTRVCLTPGRWGVTFSPISNRWRGFNEDIKVEAGELIDMPFVRIFQ